MEVIFRTDQSLAEVCIESVCESISCGGGIFVNNYRIVINVDVSKEVIRIRRLSAKSLMAIILAAAVDFAMILCLRVLQSVRLQKTPFVNFLNFYSFFHRRILHFFLQFFPFFHYGWFYVNS